MSTAWAGADYTPNVGAWANLGASYDVVATDTLTISDVATHSGVISSRSVTDVLATVVDTPSRLLFGSRFSVDILPETDDVPERTLFANRAAMETTSVIDFVNRQLSMYRAVGEAALATSDSATFWRTTLAFVSETVPEPTDTTTRVSILQRVVFDFATAMDEVSTQLMLLREAGDDAPAVDEALRTLHLQRGLSDVLPAIGDSTVTVRSLTRVVTDWLDAVTDAVAYQIIDALYGLAKPTITEISQHRVGPGGQIDIEFSFAQPVTAWSLRLGSTSPYDGVEVASWIATGAGISSDSTSIEAEVLSPGTNHLAIYARSSQGGRWD